MGETFGREMRALQPAVLDQHLGVLVEEVGVMGMLQPGARERPTDELSALTTKLRTMEQVGGVPAFEYWLIHWYRLCQWLVTGQWA